MTSGLGLTRGKGHRSERGSFTSSQAESLDPVSGGTGRTWDPQPPRSRLPWRIYIPVGQGVVLASPGSWSEMQNLNPHPQTCRMKTCILKAPQ